nr:HepT-like ribonuclease domain-containing protein [Exiguobacterium acetylicum]
MYVVSTRKLGLPKASQDGFKLLEEADFINSSLSTSLMNMMGFCTIAIHNYPSLDLNVLQAILEKHTNDFLTFAQIVIHLED